MTRRTIAIAALALTLVAAAALGLQRPPAVAGPAVATLLVFTGAVQVAPTGGLARVASSGAGLRDGEVLTTGPVTRAALVLAEGGAVRVDSNSILTVKRAGITLIAGRTWSRARSGRTTQVDGPAGVAVTGGEFRLEASAGGSARVIAVGGATTLRGPGFRRPMVAGQSLAISQGQQPRSVPEPAADGWTTFNRALDASPGRAAAGAAIAIGSGSLGGGEQSTLQQGVQVTGAASPELTFSIDWPEGPFELSVLGPDGLVSRIQGADTPPLVISIARAAAGSWQYRVRNAGDSGPAQPWTVVVTTTVPSPALT